MQLGNRITTDYPRVDKNLVEEARHIPVAVIGDVSNRLFSFSGGYRNYSLAAKSFAGPAFTVRVRPGDNLYLHKALDIASPGDIVICDAGGAVENAILGEMMGRYAASRGVAGIIINGAIRDRAGLATLPIPVYAMSVTPNGPYKSGPGEVGYPIATGGVSIASGDLVVGDEDGVIVLPRDQAANIIAKAKAHAIVEERWADEISKGTWPRGWVDQALAAL